MRTCTSTRMGFHPISHTSPVTGGARRAKRKNLEAQASEGRARSREHATFIFAPLFRPARFLHLRHTKVCRAFGRRKFVGGVSRTHLKGVVRGSKSFRALGVRLSRPSVGENRVARCGASSSNLLCIQRGRIEQREERIVRGNAVRAIPCGG